MLVDPGALGVGWCVISLLLGAGSIPDLVLLLATGGAGSSVVSCDGNSSMLAVVEAGVVTVLVDAALADVW